MSAVAPSSAKLSGAGIEIAWFGSGINAVQVPLHIAPDSDVTLLSRLCYSAADSLVLWPEVVPITSISSNAGKLAVVGAWTDRAEGLQKALQAMSEKANVVLVALYSRQPILDNNGLMDMVGWRGAWSLVPGDGGYIVGMVRNENVPTCDLAVAIDKKIAKSSKQNEPGKVTLSLDDPYAGLAPANLENDKKVKEAAEMLKQQSARQFVDAGKKRPRVSLEMPQPSKSCKLLVASPEIDGARVLSPNDILKLLGYQSGMANITLLTECEQMSVLGKSVPHAIGVLLVQLAAVLRKHVC